MSRRGFACRNWLSKSLLDDAPDKVTHSYTAQSSAGLERAVEILRKVNSSPHRSIFTSLCIHVNVDANIGLDQMRKKSIVSSDV